ncbi:hypothetical protein HZS_4624 [Henneguya salminicola]|nr:hypothetical protein HZS_4624 [Henneguya salminicola]
MQEMLSEADRFRDCSVCELISKKLGFSNPCGCGSGKASRDSFSINQLPSSHYLNGS